jgi:hypothetical protein
MLFFACVPAVRNRRSLLHLSTACCLSFLSRTRPCECFRSSVGFCLLLLSFLCVAFELSCLSRYPFAPVFFFCQYRERCSELLFFPARSPGGGGGCGLGRVSSIVRRAHIGRTHTRSHPHAHTLTRTHAHTHTLRPRQMRVTMMGVSWVWFKPNSTLLGGLRANGGRLLSHLKGSFWLAASHPLHWLSCSSLQKNL